MIRVLLVMVTMKMRIDDADDGVLLAHETGGKLGDGHAGVAVDVPGLGGGEGGAEAQVHRAEFR